MRLLIISIFALFFTSVFAQDEDVFDLEKDAPKKEKKKVEVTSKVLSELLLSGDYSKLEESFDDLENGTPEKLKEAKYRKLFLSYQIQVGKYKEALEQIEKAPFNVDEEAIFISSEIFRLTGNYDKAKKAVSEGRVKYPEGFMLNYQYWNLGKITGNDAEERDGWSKMKGLYKKTKYGKEGEAFELAFIGRSAVQRSPQTAYNLFQRAYKRDSKYLDVFIWAGEHCADKYAWNFAIEEYSKALQLNSKHALANAGMAYVLMEKGDYQKARELVDTALQTNPQNSYAIQLKSELLLADEKNYEALRLLKKGLESNPKDLEILSQVAAVYEQLSETEKRDEYIKKVLEINPKFSSVYIYISQSCENRRQFPMAVEWAKKAMDLNSKDWEGYYVAGMNLLRLGEETEGYKTLDRAFRLNGFNIWARNILVLLDRDFKKKEYRQFETEHFVVKLHRSESEIMWPYLEDVLEKAYEKYTKKYDIEPVGPKEYDGKILLLMFDKHQDFSARTVGLPGLGALGACFGQIITMPSPVMGKGDPSRMFNWKRVFEHEFVHVLTLQKSSYHIPRWFTEGISTWEEQDPQSEVDRQLKWAWKNGRLLPLEDINSGFSQQTYPNQIGVSYYQASLISDYLSKTYGFDVIKKMIKLFRDGKSNEVVLEEATGKKLGELNKEVKAHLDQFIGKIPLSITISEKELAELESKKNSFGLDKQQTLDLAAAYIHYKMDKKAEEVVDEFITKNPDNARAFAIKAFIFFQRNEKETSKEYFEKVAAIEENHYAANYFLGMMSEEAKEVLKAIEYYKKALKTYPRVANPQNNLYYKIVELYDSLDKKDEVLATLKEHTINNNKSFDGFVKYADRLVEHGKDKEAIDAYMNANYIFPFDLRVHIECGKLLQKNKRWDEALREFKVAREIEPRAKDALRSLTECYIELKKPEEAKVYLDKLKRFYPDEDLSDLEKKLSGSN